jgi:general secretion pathway protein G
LRARALAALLLLVCACRHQEKPAPDAALKDNLFQMRKAIDNFYETQKRYPYTLEELVPNYLRRIPVDPVTGSAKTWRLVTEETVQPNADFTTATTATTEPRPGIIDVHSGAGKPYSEY